MDKSQSTEKRDKTESKGKTKITETLNKIEILEITENTETIENKEITDHTEITETIMKEIEDENNDTIKKIEKIQLSSCDLYKNSDL